MKKKILSLLTAFAMVFGIIAAPFTNASAAEKKAGTVVAGTSDTQQEVKVTLHKLKLDDFEKLPSKKENEDFIEGLGDPKEKYVGGRINDISKFFEGKNPEEIAGVKFTYWVFKDKDKYEQMIGNAGNYNTVADVDNYLGTTDVTKKEIESTATGKELEEITIPANENRFLWVVETSSTFKKDNKDQTITGMQAVPFGLALPLFMADGSVNKDIHVYPKNTTASEPKVDKDFKGKANANDSKNDKSDTVENKTVGDKVEYEIETIIPKGSKYKTAVWTDQMTEGLTFDETSVKVFTGEKNSETPFATENYEVKKEGNGFSLKLKDKGLEAINGQKKDVRLCIEYSATVNDKARVEIPERNDVIFHYGNDPKHGNTPEPNKPNDQGTFEVTKNWATGTTLPKDGIDVTFTLYNANTGKAVTADDLVEPTEASEKANYTAYKNSFANPFTKKATDTNAIKFEWKYLNTKYQYVAKETFNGYAANYTKGDAGKVTVENTKTDNPKPRDPAEPGVKTYGHRFQKIDETNNAGIKGAEFVVKNGNAQDAKYLKEKNTQTKNFDQATYAAAEKAYKEAVKENKEASEIAKLKDARDKAYVSVNTQWEFTGTSKEDAYVFTSDEEGYFKVTGLAKGKYFLEEKKAPQGYALLTSAQEFTIAENSEGTTELKGEELQDNTGFLQIKNKKITIPQTGGIGSLIFIVAGAAIMIGAFVAYKRSQAVEA